MVHRILTIITRLTRLCLQSLHLRFVAWTKPNPTSLLLGTLLDLSRSKAELVAENALLRQQLIILRRQVKRPTCCIGYLPKFCPNWWQHAAKKKGLAERTMMKHTYRRV